MPDDPGVRATMELLRGIVNWRHPAFRRSVVDGVIVALITLSAGFFSFSYGMGDILVILTKSLKKYNFDNFLLAQIVLGLGFIFFSVRRLTDLYLEVSRRVSVETLAEQLITLDSLTGLPNRAHFLDEITRSTLRTERSNGFAAVLAINIRSFRSLNDGLGCAAGDMLLMEFSNKLKSVVRGHERLARLEADNFGLIMEFGRNDDIDDVKTAVQRLWDVLNRPTSIEDTMFDLHVNIGVALYPHDAADAQTLLRFSDAAMRRGKLDRSSGIAFFERSASEKLRERAALQLELKKAIQQGQILPSYQPLVDLQNGSLLGYEILARWHHPERGMIPPDKFIPIAEASGLMTDLTLSVLEAACRGWKIHNLRGRLALNVSPKDLRDPWFSQRLLGVLTKVGFPASHLEIEITENTIIEDLAATQSAILSLKNQGIKIALDDFGVGYSNLSQLTKLCIDKIKIDRLFISRMLEDKANMAVVKTIVGLARVMGIPALAEGIETREQADILRSMGCQFGQGFLFSRPLAAADLPEQEVAKNSVHELEAKTSRASLAQKAGPARNTAHANALAAARVADGPDERTAIRG